MQTHDFWDSAAKKYYDNFILTNGSPYEIKRLLETEDRFINESLTQIFSNDDDVVFIEIGSGTGRYLRLLGRKALTDNKYQKHLRHIIGIDFSKSMIETSIRNIIHSKKNIGSKILPLVAELKTTTNLSLQTITDGLKQKIQLIHADVTKPFLEVTGVKIVVGIMFGTLGNIPNQEAVLNHIKELVDENGEIIITIFNSEAVDVGFKTYRELAEKGFSSLSQIKFSGDTNAFTSDTGFYSRWFSSKDLKDLLEKIFHARVNIIPIASQGMLATLTIYPRSIKKESEIGLRILCPECGSALMNLPTTLSKISCKKCLKSYTIFHINGFHVPSLFSD
jgi:SAM-dependent methyltransferase